MTPPRCPICRKRIPVPDPKWHPFCSERCKLIDLSKWLDGDYAIPGTPADPEDPRDPE